MSNPYPLSGCLTAGVAAGLVGLFVFLAFHQIWIAPIWSILPVGVLIAAAGGLAVGWSFSELAPTLPARPWTTLAILAMIAAILAPSVTLGQLRPPLIDLSTMAIPPGDGARVALRFTVELVITAVLAGGTIGWLLGRTPTAALSTAAAGLAYALGPGHNIPMLANTPAVAKGLVLLVVPTIAAAVVLVEIAQIFGRR